MTETLLWCTGKNRERERLSNVKAWEESEKAKAENK